MRTKSTKKRNSSAAGFEPQFGKMIYQLGRSLSPLHYYDLLEKPTKIRLTFTLLKKREKRCKLSKHCTFFVDACWEVSLPNSDPRWCLLLIFSKKSSHSVPLTKQNFQITFFGQLFYIVKSRNFHFLSLGTQVRTTLKNFFKYIFLFPYRFLSA